MVEIEYFAIMRKFQMQNMGNIEKQDWPKLIDLPEYRSRAPADPNFYFPNDYFYELGEWQRDYRYRQAIKLRDQRNEQK